MLTSLSVLLSYFSPFPRPTYPPFPTQEPRSTQVSLSTCLFLPVATFSHHAATFQLLPLLTPASCQPVVFVCSSQSAIFLHFIPSRYISICLSLAFTTVHFLKISSAAIVADCFIFTGFQLFEIDIEFNQIA